MKRLIAGAALAAISFALAGCGDYIRGIPGELALSEGFWGWEEGAGCEGLAHAVLIEGETISFLEDGEVTQRARLTSRELGYSEREPGVRHRLETISWTYALYDENRAVIWRRDEFHISYVSFGLRWLNHWRRWETEPGGDRYAPVEDFPTRRNKLVPCEAAE